MTLKSEPLRERISVSRLSVEPNSALGLITLDQPEKMNPIDTAVRREIRQALHELLDDAAVRVIAFTGRGRAFSAGGDMQGYLTLQRDSVAFPQFLADAQSLREELWMAPKPVVALVNGISVAGGTELILGCDFAFAAASASIGDAHLKFGQMGGGGVLALLPRAILPARARELMFSGDRLSAQEALDWGLVNRVVPDDELLEAGRRFTAKVALKSPLAIANVKRTMNHGFWHGTGVPQALRNELEVTARYCLTSEDAPEGLQAFAERRAPHFTGR